MLQQLHVIITVNEAGRTSNAAGVMPAAMYAPVARPTRKSTRQESKLPSNKPLLGISRCAKRKSIYNESEQALMSRL